MLNKYLGNRISNIITHCISLILNLHFEAILLQNVVWYVINHDQDFEIPFLLIKVNNGKGYCLWSFNNHSTLPLSPSLSYISHLKKVDDIYASIMPSTLKNLCKPPYMVIVEGSILIANLFIVMFCLSLYFHLKKYDSFL